MELQKSEIHANGVRFTIQQDGEEVARAYLYFLKNDLHEQPFGFMEDVYVSEVLRGKGVGSKIIEALIQEAKDRGCYKLVGCSRHTREKVHTFYEKLGFTDHGKEFRLEF